MGNASVTALASRRDSSRGQALDDAVRELLDDLGEASLGAGDGQVVRLSEMQHDVGQCPPFTPRRRAPAHFVESVHEVRQFVELVAERSEDLVRRMVICRRCHDTARLDVEPVDGAVVGSSLSIVEPAPQTPLDPGSLVT